MQFYMVLLRFTPLVIDNIEVKRWHDECQLIWQSSLRGQVWSLISLIALKTWRRKKCNLIFAFTSKNHLNWSEMLVLISAAKQFHFFLYSLWPIYFRTWNHKAKYVIACTNQRNREFFPEFRSEQWYELGEKTQTVLLCTQSSCSP